MGGSHLLRHQSAPRFLFLIGQVPFQKDINSISEAPCSSICSKVFPSPAIPCVMYDLYEFTQQDASSQSARDNLVAQLVIQYSLSAPAIGKIRQHFSFLPCFLLNVQKIYGFASFQGEQAKLESCYKGSKSYTQFKLESFTPAVPYKVSLNREY